MTRKCLSAYKGWGTHINHYNARFEVGLLIMMLTILLGCYAVCWEKFIAAFRTFEVFSSFGYKQPELLRGLLDTADKGATLFPNYEQYPFHYTATHS